MIFCFCLKNSIITCNCNIYYYTIVIILKPSSTTLLMVDQLNRLVQAFGALLFCNTVLHAIAAYLGSNGSITVKDKQQHYQHLPGQMVVCTCTPHQIKLLLAGLWQQKRCDDWWHQQLLMFRIVIFKTVFCGNNQACCSLH